MQVFVAWGPPVETDTLYRSLFVHEEASTVIFISYLIPPYDLTKKARFFCKESTLSLPNKQLKKTPR